MVTGILTLVRGALIDPFSLDEFDLVQLFAGQVSIALQNAEAHRALEVRARRDRMTGAAGGEPGDEPQIDIDIDIDGWGAAVAPGS